MQKKNLFITFEGIDGSGKSTQARKLASRLKKIGLPVILTLEPGGTSIGFYIRKILLDPKNQNISSMTELFLYLADRAQHIREVIEPALKKGLWVISDRFYDATIAYQGYGRGIDVSFINLLNQKICGDIKPDITFLLDCPAEIALKRTFKRKSEKDQLRFEQEELIFHKMVREGYLSIANKNKKRIIRIDAKRSMNKIEEEIFNKIKEFI